MEYKRWRKIFGKKGQNNRKKYRDLRAVMFSERRMRELRVKVRTLCTEEELKRGFYPAECKECGWKGCSSSLGSYTSYFNEVDVWCPECESDDIEICDNVVEDG